MDVKFLSVVEIRSLQKDLSSFVSLEKCELFFVDTSNALSKGLFFSRISTRISIAFFLV